MMEYALALAADKGCYKAMVSSSLKHERAHPFYEAPGFDRYGCSKLTRLPRQRARHSSA